MNNGQIAEQQANRYLQSKGLKLLEQNYRSRFGEIDLIMMDKDVLVFIEVRQRQRQDYGGAIHSIDYRKQQRLIKTAQIYLSQRQRIPACRFDVIIMQDSSGNALEWIKDAFGLN